MRSMQCKEPDANTGSEKSVTQALRKGFAVIWSMHEIRLDEGCSHASSP